VIVLQVIRAPVWWGARFYYRRRRTGTLPGSLKKWRAIEIAATKAQNHPNKASACADSESEPLYEPAKAGFAHLLLRF
jgi:hypothetical protein